MFVVEFTEFLPFRIKLHFALCVKSGERFELLENLPFLFSNIIIIFFFLKKKN